ncbi:MAG: flagellin, partial [Anaerolineales bacterium]
MALRINTNVGALEALRNLSASDRMQRRSLERLATGLRINRASDDPSGLVISEQLRAQVLSLRQAIENSQNAANMLGTAEAALTEVSSLLTQIRESVVFALNSNSPEQVSAEQDAVDNAISSIDRISQTTKFANRKLLDGSSAISVASTVGSGIANINAQNAQFDGVSAVTLNVVLTGIASRAGGSGLFASPFSSATSATILRITGPQGTEDITLASGAGSAAFESAVNAFTGNTGVFVSAGQLFSVEFGSDQTISLEVVSGTINFGGTAVTAGTGVTTDAGRDAVASLQGATVSAKGNQLRVLSSFFTGDITLDDAVTTGSSLSFKLRKSGLVFQLNSSEAVADRERIGLRNVDSSTLGTRTRSIPGQGGATVTIGGFLSSLVSGGSNDLDSNPENALRIIDKVIDQITDTRAYVGAFQKFTVETNIASLEVAAENLAASESDIRDLDFAAETAEFTRVQILFQAGTAVLGQANQI